MGSSTNAWTRQAVAALAAGSVTTFAMVGFAPPSGATTGVVDYTCSSDLTGPFVLPTEIDSPAATKVYVADPVEVQTRAVLPPDVAKLLYDDHGVRSFAGTVAAGLSVGNTASTLPQAIPATEVPDQGSAIAVPFTASGTLALTTPGDVVLKAEDLTLSLALAEAGGDPAEPPSLVVTCERPRGQAPVVDTLAVAARSSTVLSLSKAASSYGETVTATARVTTTAGSPAGDVAFVVDGLATKARVDKDGVATLDIANGKVGAHTVTASFVPGDAAHYDASTSPAVSWAVTRAASRIAPTVTGKRTSRPTKVSVRVSGAFGTEATGKVRIRLMKRGSRKAWLRVRTLSAGKAAAGFGRLGKGRYKVAVVYRGDADHLRAKKVRKFRVKRG